MFGIGEDWRHDTDPDDARWGWYLWHMSGYQRLPTRDEVAALDHEWLSDVFFNEQIFRWLSNKSGIMGVFEKKVGDGGGGIADPVAARVEPPKN